MPTGALSKNRQILAYLKAHPEYWRLQSNYIYYILVGAGLYSMNSNVRDCSLTIDKFLLSVKERHLPEPK